MVFKTHRYARIEIIFYLGLLFLISPPTPLHPIIQETAANKDLYSHDDQIVLLSIHVSRYNKSSFSVGIQASSSQWENATITMYDEKNVYCND